MQGSSPLAQVGGGAPPAPPVPPVPPVPPLPLVPALPLVPPLPVVPASGGGGAAVPHAPCVAPVGTRHIRPVQQSPVAMHASPDALQVGPPSGGGGGGDATGTHVPPSWPAGMEQAFPLQQSLDEVQRPDVATHVIPPSGDGAWQRSTPELSGRHGVPPQHSEENVHWSPPAMQHGALPV
jgi:hypothetical protein